MAAKRRGGKLVKRRRPGGAEKNPTQGGAAPQPHVVRARTGGDELLRQGYGQLREAVFLLGAATPAQAPPDHGVEVAFGGRSNAGKSSALNVLTGQASLARVSKTPGRTQQINFFALPGDGRLVDLPGYGFAKAPRAAQAAWSNLVEGYLNTRQSLRAMVLVTDVRRPLMDSDRQLVDWAVAAGVNCRAILTKADKLSRNQAVQSLNKARGELARMAEERSAAVSTSAQLFSALARTGVAELGEWLEEQMADARDTVAP